MVLTPEIVFRRYEVMGVPDSGEHAPKKSEIIQMLQVLGSGGAGLVVRASKAALDAVTPSNENIGGWVLNDADRSRNGYYYRASGAWVRGRSFPDSTAKLELVAGTSNAVTASTAAGVDPSNVVTFVIEPLADNTGPVTLSINGAAPKPVRDVAGNDLTAGIWPHGRIIQLVERDTSFRIISDPDADGAAAAAANSAAQAAADRAAAQASAASVAGMDSTAVQGRLSLTSLSPLPASDVTGATAIYYVPSSGRYAPIFNGANFVSSAIGPQLNLALSADAAHPGYHQSGRNFDLFLVNDGGTIRLVTGPSWNSGAVAGSDTARGTGAGSTDLEVFNGILVNKNTLACRFGPAAGNTVSVPARRATYVGSFRATANGQATDTRARRLLFNAYNQSMRQMRAQDAANTWTYSLSAYRQANGNAANQLEIIAGLAGVAVSARVNAVAFNSSASNRGVFTAIGLDGTTVPEDSTTAFAYITEQSRQMLASYDGVPGLGYHRLLWLEHGSDGDTQSWFGTNGGAALIRTGIFGSMLN